MIWRTPLLIPLALLVSCGNDTDPPAPSEPAPDTPEVAATDAAEPPDVPDAPDGGDGTDIPDVPEEPHDVSDATAPDVPEPLDAPSSDPDPTPPDEGPPGDTGDADDTPPPMDPGPTDAGPGPGWVVAHQEDFESVASIGTTAWSVDPVPDDGPYSDEGEYFTSEGVTAPDAWRATEPLGEGDWLTIESYTRTPATPLSQLVSVVTDPAGGTNQVLRIESPNHSDATVVRPSAALPSRYRISLRVGFASFGDGLPGDNGYDGGESAEPWGISDATGENGFYWLTILDAMPRPHNNVWIHHHRKVVIDSDNNQEAWTEIYNGETFINSGHHPVMMFALDGLGETHERIGKPFIPYAAGQWQPSGTVRAVDAYQDEEWYEVTIERFDDQFTLRVSGSFLYGGQQTYEGTIDAAAQCIWHYNRPGEAAAEPCIDGSPFPTLPGYPQWPEGVGWPDWFMFGDPHANYYEGTVHYDDVTLENWQE